MWCIDRLSHRASTPCNKIIKKKANKPTHSHRLAYRSGCWIQFLNWVSLFPGMSKFLAKVNQHHLQPASATKYFIHHSSMLCFIFIIFRCVCVCVHARVHMDLWLQMYAEARGIGSPATWVIGGCESPDTGSGTQTWVLSKSSKENTSPPCFCEVLNSILWCTHAHTCVCIVYICIISTHHT